MIILYLLFSNEVASKVKGNKKVKMTKKELERIKEFKKKQRNLDDTKMCIPELLVSYGFSVRRQPASGFLSFCPQVDNPCCSVEDQKVIYNSWILQDQKENLEKKLEWIQGIYKSLFKNLENIQKKAEAVHKRLESKNVSNCQILARRLTQMQISYVKPKLEEVIQYMYDFILKSYQGIFCTICDASKHQFINIKAKTIQYSDEFCRDIVINSLHPMMYLHDFFNKYLNIITKFMNSCDFEGNFIDRIPNPKYLFHSDYKHHNMLTTCNEQRNKVDWLESCEPICKEFKPSTFNSVFFAPNLKRFFEYNQYLQNQISLWETKEKSKSQNSAQQQRLLEETKEMTKEEKDFAKLQAMNPSQVFNKNQWIKYAEDAVFSSGINAMVNLDEYTPSYKAKGLNLYASGNASVITGEQYDKIQLEIGSRKLKALKGVYVPDLEDEGLINLQRKLQNNHNYSSLLNVIYFLTLLIAFNQQILFQKLIQQCYLEIILNMFFNTISIHLFQGKIFIIEMDYLLVIYCSLWRFLDFQHFAINYQFTQMIYHIGKKTQTMDSKKNTQQNSF